MLAGGRPISQLKFDFFQTADDGVSTRYQVLTGWDRPLRRFHLTVFRIGAGGRDEEVVWDCLRLPQAALAMFTHPAMVLMIVRGFTHQVPDTLAADLEDHQARDAGNEIVTYDTKARPCRPNSSS